MRSSLSRRRHDNKRPLRFRNGNHDKNDSTVLVFDNDFVAPLVMQLLDIPSLVAFSSTSRYHRGLLRQEVKRRKERFQQIKSEIETLLSPPHSNPPLLLQPIPRRHVEQALLLQNEARMLIDSGLGWLHDMKHVQDRVVSGDRCTICQRDRFFLEERLYLKPHDIHDLSCHSLCLPPLFYTSVFDSADCTCLSENAINTMSHLTTHLWLVERLSYSRKTVWEVMEHAYLTLPYSPYFCNFDHPLRIFDEHQTHRCYDIEQLSHQVVNRTASRLLAQQQAQQGGSAAGGSSSSFDVEAFRVAARLHVQRNPLSLPFLLWILSRVEEMQKAEGCNNNNNCKNKTTGDGGSD